MCKLMNQGQYKVQSIMWCEQYEQVVGDDDIGSGGGGGAGMGLCVQPQGMWGVGAEWLPRSGHRCVGSVQVSKIKKGL